MQYYDQWVQVLRGVQKIIPRNEGSSHDLALRLEEVCRVYRNLAEGPKTLLNLDATFKGSGYTLEWKNKAKGMVAKVKSFSEVSRSASAVS